MNRYFYTLTIIIGAVVALVFPQIFVEIGGFQVKKLLLPILQMVMLSMGATMTLKDFEAVIKSPKSVIVGLVCQFTIMPFLGFALANAFGFAPEIAAGVILIGCSPSGLASNVISYIAKANVALSLTITSLATFLSPFLTPFLMKTLAGSYIEIDFWKMMWDISNIVIFPIALGLILNKIFRKQVEVINKMMPIISMLGITLTVCIVTAAGRNSLLDVGFTLVLCVLLHNLIGYLLGYFGAKLSKLPEKDCRTVAIEVGLQNGGLATGIALQMGKMATIGLAPALFSSVMNITGSLLASWWAKR